MERKSTIKNMRYEVRLYYTHLTAEVITTRTLEAAENVINRRWFYGISRPIKVEIAGEDGRMIKDYKTIKKLLKDE